MFKESIIPVDYPNFSEFGPTPCSQTDPDTFFPEDRPSTTYRQNSPAYPMEREAKLVCQGCPYKLRCLEYAIKNDDLIGIWGGTTEVERRRFKRTGRLKVNLPSHKQY